MKAKAITSIIAGLMALSSARAVTVEVFTTYERPLNAFTIRLFPFLVESEEEAMFRNEVPFRPLDVRLAEFIDHRL